MNEIAVHAIGSHDDSHVANDGPRRAQEKDQVAFLNFVDWNVGAEIFKVDRTSRHIDIKMVENIVHESRAVKSLRAIAGCDVRNAQMFFCKHNQAVAFGVRGIFNGIVRGRSSCFVRFFALFAGSKKHESDNKSE